MLGPHLDRRPRCLIVLARDGSCHKKYLKIQANVMSGDINVMSNPVNVMSGVMSGPHTTKSGQITLWLRMLKKCPKVMS